MQQEINLYLLLPEQKKSFLTLRLMLISYSFFIFLLFFNFCLDLWTEHKERNKGAELTQELRVTTDKLMQIHTQYPMLDLNDMENSLKKLQKELDAKNSVYNLLTQGQNFSSYLVGVSKAAVDHMWVKDIEVNIEDGEIRLRGSAMHASAIQQFINNLSLQKEFSGFNFQLEAVTKEVVKKETLLNFVIATKVTNNEV